MSPKIHKTCKNSIKKPHKTCKSTLKVVFYALFENPRFTRKNCISCQELT